MYSKRRTIVATLFAFTVLLACSRPPSRANAKDEAVAMTQTLPRLPGGPLWNIESVGPGAAGQNKSFEIRAQEKFMIVGWAVDQQAKGTAGGVEVVIDDAPFVAEYGKSRPDVASAFGVPAYTNSGFTIGLAAQQFPLGAHRFYVRVLTHDRKGYWEVGPYTITFK